MKLTGNTKNQAGRINGGKFTQRLFSLLLLLVMLFDASPVAVLAESMGNPADPVTTESAESSESVLAVDVSEAKKIEITLPQVLTHESADYSMEGALQMLLSDLISQYAALGIEMPEITLPDVESVAFTGDHAVTVQQVSGMISYNNVQDTDVGEKDFLLTSMEPFTSEEQFTLVLKNGAALAIGTADKFVAAEGSVGSSGDVRATVAFDVSAGLPASITLTAEAVKDEEQYRDTALSMVEEAFANLQIAQAEAPLLRSMAMPMRKGARSLNMASPDAAAPETSSEPETIKRRETRLAGVFDLTILDGDTPLQPEAPVTVTVEVDEPIPENSTVYAVHFTDGGVAESPIPATVKDGTMVSFPASSFSVYVIAYTVDFVYEVKRAEISLDFAAYELFANVEAEPVHENREGVTVIDIEGFVNNAIVDEEKQPLCGVAYGVSLDGNAQMEEFDGKFFGDAAVSIEGSGVEFTKGQICLTDDVESANVTFTTERAALTVQIANYLKPEKPVVPEKEEGFTYRFFNASATVEEILAENEIVSSHYEIISLSDEKLVVIEKDGLTVQDYFDEVTLTLSLSDGTEVEIALSNPTPVEAGETVTTEGVGSFAADKEVPAGTKLMVNANPEVPEGITIGGGKKRGGPVESDPIFYEISLIGPDGKEIQTGANVTIATDIKLPQEDGKVTKVTDVTVYHVDEKGNAEPLEKADYALAEGKISSVSFATPGFSLFAVTYTVEYIAGGQEYSIVGGGVMSLRELLNALYVNIEIEEIDSVSFSNEELVRAAYVAEDTTAGALKEALGVEPSYSAELTEEEIAEMDALTLTAPDWALISLLPFKTDEKLTILLLDGQEYEIAVTDGQIVRYYIDSKGDTYEISVTFEDDAEIPEDATLDVAEIEPDSDEWYAYCGEALTTAQGECLSFARFFDITILDADGEKVTPKAAVSVNVRLADLPEDDNADTVLVHFKEDNSKAEQTIPEILTYETDTEKGIVFSADTFSVYGVITMPTATPSGVDDLNGRTFKIKGNVCNTYMTSETTTESGTRRFTGTNNSDDAAVWQFESAGEAGKYYISTIISTAEGNVKKYLRLNRHSENAARGELDDSPQAFTVTQSGDKYILSAISEKNGGAWRYYFFEARTGFLGTNNGEDTTCLLTLEFQDPTVQAGTQYMLLTKYEGSYYIIHNDGTLALVDDPDELVGQFKIDDPMVWNYNGNNLYHSTKETGFYNNNLASDYYYRYLDPDVDAGYTDEDITTTTGHESSNKTKTEYFIDSRPFMDKIKITYANNKISSQTNTFQYIGIVRDEDGTLRIAGRQTEQNAAEIYFVGLTAEAAANMIYDWRQGNDIHHTVNHIDISVVGNAAFSVPLAYGTYYYKENGTVKTLVVTKDHPVTVDVTKQVDVTREDVKRAQITAYTIDENGTHHEKDNVFYITGYSGNNTTGASTNQTRIEGVFKVADLPDVDTTKTSGEDAEWTYKSYYNENQWGPSDKILQDRLDNRIYYSVSTTKEIVFDLEYNGCILYETYEDTNNQTSNSVAKGNATVTLSQSFDYWDSRNECPAIEVTGRYGHYGTNANLNRKYWRKGGINFGWDEITGSGMDFALGTVDKNVPGILAIEITKFIVDETGAVIPLRQNVNNVFHIYQKANPVTKTAADADVTAMQGLDVDAYDSTQQQPAYTGYSHIHDKSTTVAAGGGIGIVYDYDVPAGMVYIEEDTSEENLPRTIQDEYGKIWTYAYTRFETEYVWRDDGIEDRRHVSKDYTDNPDGANEDYNSIPDVLGSYKDINGISRYNGFLEFYVYNVYTVEPIDVPVKKEWKHQNGTVAEAPDGAEITVTLGRLSLQEDAEHPVSGKLTINHTVSGLQNGDNYYASYKVMQGNKVVRSLSYDPANPSVTMNGLPAGDYTLKVSQNASGYTATTKFNNETYNPLSLPITISVNGETTVNVNTDLTQITPPEMIKVVVTNSLYDYSNNPNTLLKNNYQDQSFSFPAGSRIAVTISRPGRAYQSSDSFKAYIYGSGRSGCSATASSNSFPWPSDSEAPNSYPNIDQTLIYQLPSSNSSEMIQYRSFNLYFQHNWSEESFWVKSVTLAEDYHAPSSSSGSGNESQSSGTLIYELHADIPGSKYADDPEWEPIQLTLSNGKWEDIFKDLPAVDKYGNKYLYYISGVTETGFDTEHTTVVIATDESGNVLTSNGETTLGITNTIPNKKLTITIKKVDDNGQALAGASFTFAKPNSVTETVIINEADGIYTSGELDDGDYTISELTAPNGYTVVSGAVSFTVANNAITVNGDLPDGVTYDEENYAFIFENHPTVTSGSLKLLKKWQDFDGNEISGFGSVNLRLLQLAQNPNAPKHRVTVNFRYTGDGNGNAGENSYLTQINGEGSGTATLIWKLAEWVNESYCNIQNGKITVQSDDTVAFVEQIGVETIEYNNETKSRAIFKITIMDSNEEANINVLVENNNWPAFSGSSFSDISFANDVEGTFTMTRGYKSVTLGSGNWSQEFTYNGDGLLSNESSTLPATYNGRPCRYVVVEENVPAGYAVSYSDNNTLGLGNGETGTLTAYNRKTTTNLNLIKVDQINHEQPLAGAEFKIFKINPEQTGVVYMDWDYNGANAANLVTGTDGRLTFTNLSAGYYEIMEVHAPAGYVIIGDGCFYVKVTEGGVFSIEKDPDRRPDKWTIRANDSLVAVNAAGTVTVGNISKGSLQITKAVTVNGQDDTSNLTDGTYTLSVMGVTGTATAAEPDHTIAITFANGRATKYQIDSGNETPVTNASNNTWAVVLTGLIPGDYVIRETNTLPEGMTLASVTGGKGDGNTTNKTITATVTAGDSTPTSTAAQVVFTNNKTVTGTLEVTKHVQLNGTEAPVTEDKSFTVGLYKLDTANNTWVAVQHEDNGTQVNWTQTITVTANNATGTATFAPLDVGETYRVYELDGSNTIAQDALYQEYKVTYSDDNGVDVTVTAASASTTVTNNKETTTINASKTWGDATTVPTGTSITWTITAKDSDDADVTETVIPTEADRSHTVNETPWTTSWSDLPKVVNGKAVTYTVAETAATYGTHTYTADEIAVATVNSTTTEGTFAFTNDLPTIDIPVEKSWSGTETTATDYVEITLYKNEETTAYTQTGLTNPVTLRKDTDATDDVDTDWKGSFTGLPMYDADGNAITYKVVETEVKLGSSRLTDPTLIKIVYGNADDTVVSTGTISTVTITNTKQTANYKVKKSWPTGRTVPTGTEVVFTISATVPGATEGTTTDPNGLTLNPASVTLDGIIDTGATIYETREWEYEWANLPKYDLDGKQITYTIAETAYTIGTDYAATTFPTAVVTTEDDTTIFTFTNELPTRNIVVEKAWSPTGWPTGIASVTVGLYQSVNGETTTTVTSGDPATDRTITITKENSAAGALADLVTQRTFSNLPVYDTDGNPITYSVQEIAITPTSGTAETVTGGAVTVNGQTWTVLNGGVTDGIATVTNTYSGMSINVTKQWTKGVDPKTTETSIGFTLHQVLTPESGSAIDRVYSTGTVTYNPTNHVWNTVIIPNLPLQVTEPVTTGEREGETPTTVTYAASYYVVETDGATADAGYVLTTTYSNESGAVNPSATATDKVLSGAGTITIINTETPGVELPSTGGTGTLPYTLSGLTLLLGAALILFLRRKREQN